MNLSFYNCPQPQEIESVRLPEPPGFLAYRPDFGMMKKLAAEYGRYPNMLVIGHGGSITSFYGMYHALIEQAGKKAYFLSTVDPDYIFELKKILTPENTAVVAISKSGETVTQLEALSQFLDYPLIFITGKTGSLRSLGEKLGLGAFGAPSQGIDPKGSMIEHPPIGGRYTGLTEVGLLPAAMAGLDAEGLYKGAQKLYAGYAKDNLAFRLASVLWQLEQDGFADVFMPFYSHNLFPLSNLIVQLCHESFGKQGRGQTYFAHEAPESQHHTNQRFFGGPKNICACFISSESVLHPLSAQYPTAAHSVQVRGRALFDLNNIPLQRALEFELQGTMEDARIQGIPAAHLSIAGFSPEEIGSLAAFWQLYAVYGSVLRGVDPFDQPQVENSKNISFNKRLQFKGLL